MRLIFTPRLQECKFLESLVWLPSKEFLDDLRMVFEGEEQHIRGEPGHEAWTRARCARASAAMCVFLGLDSNLDPDYNAWVKQNANLN